MTEIFVVYFRVEITFRWEQKLARKKHHDTNHYIFSNRCTNSLDTALQTMSLPGKPGASLVDIEQRRFICSVLVPSHLEVAIHNNCFRYCSFSSYMSGFSSSYLKFPFVSKAARSLPSNNKFTVPRFLQDIKSLFSKFTPSRNKWSELQQDEKSCFTDYRSGSTSIIWAAYIS